MNSQVKNILKNPKLLDDAPHRVIYNELLNPELNTGEAPPTVAQLCDDAQTLFGAGSLTTGTTLMIGVHYLLRNPEAKQRLEDEVRTVWPDLDQPPSYEVLEKLPFLVSAFICRTRVCSEHGTDCCDQRDAARFCNGARWPSTRSAAIWCRIIWC